MANFFLIPSSLYYTLKRIDLDARDGQSFFKKLQLVVDGDHKPVGFVVTEGALSRDSAGLYPSNRSAKRYLFAEDLGSALVAYSNNEETLLQIQISSVENGS